VETTKEIYKIGETIQIDGTLIVDSTPVTDGLVALQINDRTDPLAYRTLDTGTVPQDEWKIEILNAYIGDDQGNPLTSVKRSSQPWIWIYYENNILEPVYTLIAFTIYGADGSSLFAFTPSAGEVPPGGPYFTAYMWQVPSDAQLGTATLCASAFSGTPKNGGIPHCPEKSYNFTITSTTSATQTSKNKPKQTTTSGTFSTTLHLPNGARIGNYSVYVTSGYWGLYANSSAFFQVILEGDLNGDKIVDGRDLGIVGRAYGSKPGDDRWNDIADVYKDDFIDGRDLGVVGRNYGRIAS